MEKEAQLKRTEHGLVPEGDGWFVLNARDARWIESDKFGAATRFEGDPPFQQIGLNIRVLAPGQPNCHYHREDQQEDFLVLAGECRLLVEGQVRLLKAWDLVHCPPNTNHVFVGAGSGPCTILMVGHRDRDAKIVYPVEESALRYGAGVERETTSPAEAYAGVGERRFRNAPPTFG